MSETKAVKATKLTKMQRNIIIVVSVLVALITAGILYNVLKPDDKQKVEVYAVSTGDIQQTVSTSGTVECDDEAAIEIPIGTKVLEVNVKEGDVVKQGDVLATFDISSAKTQLKAEQTAYNEAMKAYKESLNSSSTAADALKSVDSQIAEVERQLKAMGGDASSTDYNAQQLIQMIQMMKNSGMSITDMIKMGEALKNSGVDMSESMADAVTSMTSGLEAQLVELKAKKAIYEVQSTLAMSDIYKATADASKEKITKLETQINNLSNGLVAEKDGVITALNISANTVFAGAKVNADIDWSSLLSGGLDVSSVVSMVTSMSENSSVGVKIAYHDGYKAVFSVGKYDILNLKLGQQAVISSTKNKFDGEVNYISAVAGSSGSSSVLDISSITGALTGSSAGVPVSVTINNPDESVIIGFDVDVDIVVDEHKDVLTVPFEAILTEGSDKFVYVYNQKSKKIEKTQIEVGISSDSYCEVLSGLENGDVIVKAITSSLEDGMKIYPTNKLDK